MNPPKTILLIHGASSTPAFWANFKARFERKGYTVLAPAWPYYNRPAAELAKVPDPRVARLTLAEIADHFERFIRKLPDLPILMGHAFGGLIVQILLKRGLGAAGVALSPVPPSGVREHPTALASSVASVLANIVWVRGLLNAGRSVFRKLGDLAVLNQRTPAEMPEHVPMPRRIFLETLNGPDIGGGFGGSERAPLLLIAADQDRSVPMPLVRTHYFEQIAARTQTDYKVFKGRSHLLCLERGWEEIADYVLTWASVAVMPAIVDQARQVREAAERLKHDWAWLQAYLPHSSSRSAFQQSPAFGSGLNAMA